ncbi:MAG: tetratricopeptide repeat protein [Nannocystales bacterium]
MKRTPNIAFARTCAGLCAAAVLQSSVAWAAPPSDDAAPESAEPAAAPESAEPTATPEDTPSDGDPTAEQPTDEASADGEPSDTAPAEPPPGEPVAEEPDPAEQEAAALFREGSMFYELGQYEDAISKFETAWKLAPVPQLLFNLGQAHRRWYELDPDIDHLRQSKSFFINYQKRMNTDSSYSAREADYVQNMIEKLEAQIELEENKEAERNRVIVNGPSADELEALEKRRIEREKKLASARRLNGAGIGLIVVGATAAGVGLGGALARTAYKVVLDNSSTGDPNSPTLATAEEDRRRRNGFLLSGQVGFGGLIAAAVFLPIGIGLRVGGGVLERRTLATPEADPKEGADTPRTEPPPKVAIEPTATGLALHF